MSSMFFLYDSPMTRTRAPLRPRLAVRSSASTNRLTTYCGMLVLISPASSTNLRGDAVLAGLPGKVEGINRDAVTAEPRARVERHEAERLSLGGLDHLPDIDPHPLEDDLQFVHEGDVH